IFASRLLPPRCTLFPYTTLFRSGRGGGRHLPRPAPSAAALLADAHADLDRRALESEALAQPALDEPPVAVLDEPGGEQHETRGPVVGLGAEQDPRLLSAPHRVRVRRGELTEEGVEP